MCPALHVSSCPAVARHQPQSHQLCQYLCSWWIPGKTDLNCYCAMSALISPLVLRIWIWLAQGSWPPQYQQWNNNALAQQQWIRASAPKQQLICLTMYVLWTLYDIFSCSSRNQKLAPCQCGSDPCVAIETCQRYQFHSYELANKAWIPSNKDTVQGRGPLNSQDFSFQRISTKENYHALWRRVTKHGLSCELLNKAWIPSSRGKGRRLDFEKQGPC